MILIISLLQLTLNYLHVVYQRYEVLRQQRVVGKALAESEKLDVFLKISTSDLLCYFEENSLCGPPFSYLQRSKGPHPAAAFFDSLIKQILVCLVNALFVLSFK